MPTYGYWFVFRIFYEIEVAGIWGTVCDDYVNDADASVACSMLGFGYDHTQVVVTDNCWFIVLGLLLLTIQSMDRYAIKFTVFSVFVRGHLADVGNKRQYRPMSRTWLFRFWWRYPKGPPNVGTRKSTVIFGLSDTYFPYLTANTSNTEAAALHVN